MNDGRTRTSRILATLGAAAISSSMLVAAPTQAAPDIDGVQNRVERLYHQAEQASERYNNARIELTKATKRLRTLHTDLGRQRSKVSTLRRQVASDVVAQYQGQALSSTTQVLTAADPDSFIDQLTTISQFNDQRAQMMADFAVQAKRLEGRQADARREVSRIAATKKKLGVEQARIDEKAAEAKQLLGRLKDRAAARASRSQERTSSTPTAATPAPPASGRAAAAVRYALAQVGKSYVYGAAGPSAFDCSGLTMMAWQQAGVSLPHSSGAQMGSGTPVSQSQLQPGDLVFYYSPVSHVGIYIGNGQIANALNPSSGVRISGVNSMPYSGAVRPG